MVRDTAVADGGSPDPAADIVSYRRRLLLLLLTAAFAAAMTVMARLLGADGIGVADLLLLACFALMLPWNLLGLGNAAIGLWLLATATCMFALDQLAREQLRAGCGRPRLANGGGPACLDVLGPGVPRRVP